MQPAIRPEDRFWNPYLAGVLLGLVLLASFLIMGKGLGASGAANRMDCTMRASSWIAAHIPVRKTWRFRELHGPLRI